LAFALLAAALIVAGKRVVPQETAILDKPPLPDPETRDEVRELVRSGGEGVSRRGLILGAAAVAGCGVGAAVALPIASLGPDADARLARTPWRRGRYLVDERGERFGSDDLAVGGFVTAFPEGADKEDLGSSIVIVRLLPDQFDMTPEQMAGVVDGLVAYSKICTHAACAVSMYRYPLSQPTTESKPALVCPCHYSTFNPAKAAKVEFGPAGRPLPQLPLMLDEEGLLVAAGEYAGTPGPAWWSVRQ
jgi:ubiquinol-cytochrome c reductase iron-sulfur subunit